MKSETKKVTFLEKLTDFIENRLAPPLVKVAQIRYLQTLQKTFMVMMPYLILGATATLVLNLGGLFAEETGLGMPQVAEAINGVIAHIQPMLLQMVFISINLMAFLCVVLNSYFLGEYYKSENSKISPIVCGVLGMTSFLSFIDFMTLSENFDWPNYILGAPSLFSAIVISIISIELYRWFINKNITIKMPDGVPPMVAAAFTSLIPVTVVIILSTLVGRNIENFNFLTIINDASSHLVVAGSSPVTQFVAFMLDRIFWFVGLHGSNIVGSIMTPIWESMVGQNLIDFASGQPVTYVFSSLWVNAYVRLSVFPIACLLIRSKVKRFKTLGKLSFAGSIFNIAEPIMYGLPIVLNPLMFVPWVLGFGALFIFNGILTWIGIVPPIVANVVWTMPVPLMAFIGSGFKVSAMLISIMNMVILFFIFLPFFRVMEKQELEIEKQNEDLQNAILKVDNIETQE